MNENELMHYGIPGMKWGHRKNIMVHLEINTEQVMVLL